MDGTCVKILHLVFSFSYFNGDMFRPCRPSSGRLAEYELKVHAVQICSMEYLKFLYLLHGVSTTCKAELWQQW